MNRLIVLGVLNADLNTTNCRNLLRLVSNATCIALLPNLLVSYNYLWILPFDQMAHCSIDIKLSFKYVTYKPYLKNVHYYIYMYLLNKRYTRDGSSAYGTQHNTIYDT